MKHAILITAHDNTSVVRTLMRMLDDVRFVFYLLVDKKSNYEVSDFIPELQNAKIVVVDRVRINWGGYSQIEAQLRLLELALRDEPDYLHYVQGADLPLKSSEEIDKFFELNAGDLYIDVSSAPDAFANYKVYCKHYFTNNPYFRTNKFVKVLDHGIAHLYKPFIKRKSERNPLYAGSALWSIPADFGRFVVCRINEIKKKYSHSLAADEVFMQTLLMESQYKEKLSVYGGARLIDWKHRDGNSPKTFTIKDKRVLAEAIVNPNFMFARKFSESKDMEIIYYLEDEIINKSINKSTYDNIERGN